MERGEIGGIYHFSPDQGIRVRDLVKEICQVIGEDFRSNTIDVGERLGQDKAYVIDSTKARDEFVWLPEITLTDGLRQVKNWVEEEWNLICSEPLEYVHRP